MKRFITGVGFVLLAVGCGTDGFAPTVSSVSMSRPDVRRGTEFFATATVRDMDGDIGSAKVTVVMESVEGGTSLETSIVATDIAPGDTEGDVIVGLTLFGDIDLGAYELFMSAEDAAGNVSEDSMVRLLVEQ